MYVSYVQTDISLIGLHFYVYKILLVAYVCDHQRQTKEIIKLSFAFVSLLVMSHNQAMSMSDDSLYPAMTRDQREYFECRNNKDKVVVVDYNLPLIRMNTPPTAHARGAGVSSRSCCNVDVTYRSGVNAKLSQHNCDNASKRQVAQEHSRLPHQTHIIPDNERSFNVHVQAMPSTNALCSPSPLRALPQRCVTDNVDSNSNSNNNNNNSGGTNYACVAVLSLNPLNVQSPAGRVCERSAPSPPATIFSTSPTRRTPRCRRRMPMRIILFLIRILFLPPSQAAGVGQTTHLCPVGRYARHPR